jgi:hypothetical protein
MSQKAKCQEHVVGRNIKMTLQLRKMVVSERGFLDGFRKKAREDRRKDTLASRRRGHRFPR